MEVFIEYIDIVFTYLQPIVKRTGYFQANHELNGFTVIIEWIQMYI